MKTELPESSLPADVVERLQESLLRAVLTGQSLPGSDQPIRFPDARLIEAQPRVFVVNENLAGPMSLTGLSKPFQVRTLNELQNEARQHGNLVYFYFHPPAREGGAILLTLEARIIPQNPEHHALGLGGMQVKFQNVEGQWKPMNDQSSFAT